jgi:tRNA G18 (ribose-2'-O)-methylase SpoU
VGAMFRNADVFGITKIFLCGYTAYPPKPQIDKVSLGAEKWMPWKYYKSTKRCINALKKKGIKIVALEKTNSSKSIKKIKFSEPVALVVGNEVDGVSQDILDLCDSVAHIDMYGKKESLNVSVASGIAMFEIKEQLKNKISFY